MTDELKLERRYLDELKDAILERMLERVSNDIDKREGSVTYDLLSPAALELENSYIQLDNVLKFGFVNEDQPLEYLKLRCREQGIEQKQAQKAEGEVQLTGSEGTQVEEGQLVYTDDEDPIYFEITESGELQGEETKVTFPAIAVEAGNEGNVGSGEIVNVAGDLSGVAEVDNEEAFEGGTDDETFDSLMDRYLKRVRRPATSGNEAHYEEWALEVEGRGDVLVKPLWNGAGTVKVVIIDDNKTKPDQTIIDNTAEYIEEERPIGATVTVEGAEEVDIDVTADVTLTSDGNLQEAESKFTEALTEYLKDLAFTDPVVRYAEIGSILLNVEDVLDYENLKVNEGTSNIEIDEDKVAVVGMVDLSEQQ